MITVYVAGLVVDAEGPRWKELASVIIGCEKGIGALTLHIGQVGKGEWAGQRWPSAAAVL